MTELPATIYIGIGAIIAAAITALISFVNLITTKDQNISDNRLQWINAIREDISKFIGLAAYYSSRLERIKHTEDKIKKEELQLDLFSGTDLPELYNRILLRLNTKENSDIRDAIESIEEFLISENRHDTDAMAVLTCNLRDLSQVMLKKEWKRVKRGELSYVLTKWSFIIGITISSIFGTLKVESYISTASELQQTVPEVPNKALKRN